MANDGEAGEADFARDTIENLVGGSGNDSLHGQLQLGGIGTNNLISGGLGNDLIVGDLGDDILLGDNGEDTIRAGFGDDTLAGPAEGQHDNLDGSFGDDTFIAGPEDTINPGLDNDFLEITQGQLDDIIEALLGALQDIPGLPT
jgi:hypothetical protein